MQELIIGKHTLESLTTGMYSDPFVVFREYIQNAVDSIDEAIKLGVLNKGEEAIDVILQSSEKRIVISDNGLGITCANAPANLLSIGNSHKITGETRGFRGIGRLSGLSYCETLTFETSAINENKGTRISIDSAKLNRMLSNRESLDVTVVDVLSEVYELSVFPEKESLHYFKVIMENVDSSTQLLDSSEVLSYLAQNAPVPYNPVSFSFGNEIVNRIAQKGYRILAYNIYLTHHLQRVAVFKPYADLFLADKGKKIYDQISDIQIVDLRNPDDSQLVIGWIGKTNYLGSIYDRSVKGLRYRTGNILVGDGQTMNSVFKDARFNGWSIGEIFTVDPKLIPNARRDNYEKNQSYFAMIEQMTSIASIISKDIRNASLKRNAELSAALDKTKKLSESTESSVESGISSSQKASLKAALTNARNSISNVKISGDEEAYYQEIAFEELDMLIGTLKGATSYKALNTMKSLSSTEKKTLEKVFGLITECVPLESSKIIDFIISNYSQER